MGDNGKIEARHQTVSRRRLLKSGATVGLTSAGTAIFAPTIVHAQNAGCGEFTLDKIKRTSQFSIGARQGVFPFGYLDKDNNWTGISTEIAREVHKNIEKELKMDVKLNLVAVTSQTRIPLLLNGTSDMDAGSTVVTLAREKVVDFCIPFLATALDLLVPANSSIKGWSDLAGKRMGTVQGGFDGELYARLNSEGKLKPLVQIIAFRDQPDGFQALANGSVDAYSTDGPILAGLRARAPNPSDWKIIDPELSSELYAFAVRQNDSNFRALINATFSELFHSGKFMELYDKFLGPNSQVPLPFDANMKALVYLYDLPK
jgi:ABC-type amino acid transport substrate-binding protein